MHVVHNARIQLIATAGNNIAVAAFVASLIVPGITGRLPDGSRLVVTFSWLGFGYSQLALGRLRR
jgi:hypothetical protein